MLWNLVILTVSLLTMAVSGVMYVFVLISNLVMRIERKIEQKERDKVKEIEPVAEEQDLEETLVTKFIQDTIDELPKYNTGYTQKLPSTKGIVEFVVFHFFKNNDCPNLKAKLIKNGDKLGDFDEYKGDYLNYVKDTPLMKIFEQRIPFELEDKRDLGWYICSPAGKGKTNLLVHQLLMDAKTNGSIIVLDSKGDLINAIKDLKLQKQVVVIDPDPHLALNPLQIGATSTHSVAFLEYLFSSLMETKPTALQSTLFRSIFLVLQKVPNASFATFRHFLVHGWKEYDAAIQQLDIEDQEFFYKGEYDSATYKDTKQQLLWRIRDLTTSIPLLREMFKSPTTKINMTEWMDSQHIYLINNSKQLLDDAGAEFFGRFFIAMIRAAADQRSNRKPEDKNPVRLYMDECHTVIARDEKLAGILDECRSQRIQVIAAHQRLPQIQSANVLDALSNCGIRMANSDEDAPALAPRLRATTEHLRGLPTGSFAAYVRDVTPQAVTLKIPLVDSANHPKLTRGEIALRQQYFRERYCYAPVVVEEEAVEERPPRPKYPLSPRFREW